MIDPVSPLRRRQRLGEYFHGILRKVASSLTLLGLAIPVLGIVISGLSAPAANEYLSPSAVIPSPDGKVLYVACATADRVNVLDVAAERVTQQWKAGVAPSGLALSADGKELFVTCAAPESTINVIDTSNGKVLRKLPAGHTAMAPVLSLDGKTLYVCNRFNNEVMFIDAVSGKPTARIAVPREPVAAALTPNGKLLFVANHIHAGRSDADIVASSVSVIDTASGELAKEIPLVNGSGLLRGVAVSPDGKYVCVTHLVSRFHLPTTQIERGWINTSGLTLIDAATLKPINTVLLDNIDSGAGNPWAVAWTKDGKRIVVTQAGTHEVSVIDAPAMLAKLAKMPVALPAGAKVDYTIASHVAADVPNDLSFLVGIRNRIRLPEGDKGPRAVAIIGSRAYTANYFSDSVTVMDLVPERTSPGSLSLGGRIGLTPERKGEFYFNDASICFQGWQSCASCHSSDARVDGMNWDNLNDGIGNPKNAKSLLLAFETAPAMWLSVREDASTAVRAGIKHSLFTVQPDEVAQSLDAYLKSLKPIPSPHLVNGKLSKAALRGKKLFEDEVVGCTECHKGKYFTDQKSHDVGTRSEYDKEKDIFDTPALTEVWRSGPYLHDGSAVTIRDVLTTRNQKGEHGTVRKLTQEQINDLAEYVLSL